MQALTLGTTYDIWVNKRLSIAWWAGNTSDNRTILISWDPSKTRIASARLRVVATANGRTNLKFSLNMTEVVFFHWEIWEDMATKIAEEDVTSLILNGSNLFTADFYKDIAHPFDVSATFTVTLIIEYEGVPPETRQKTWLEEYWMYIVAGAAIVLVGGVAIAWVMKR
jgi:hypothetical protein